MRALEPATRYVAPDTDQSRRVRNLRGRSPRCRTPVPGRRVFGRVVIALSVLVGMLTHGAVDAGAGSRPLPQGVFEPFPFCRGTSVFDLVAHECLPIDYLGGTVRIRTEDECPLQSFGGLDKILMEPLLQCVIRDVLTWGRGIYGARMRAPKQFVLLPIGFEAEAGHGCTLNDRTLMYCYLDGNVYVGVEAVWTQYHNYGSITVAGIMAHELTHRLQHAREFPHLTMSDRVPVENQADCGAGAFLGWLASMGSIRPEDTGDSERSLVDAGEGESHDHGSAAERVAAFRTGFDGGLAGCNVLYPPIQLVPTRRGGRQDPG